MRVAYKGVCNRGAGSVAVQRIQTCRQRCGLAWVRRHRFPRCCRACSPRCAQVLESAGKHQVLIFVHSRKETAKTARFLKEEALREDKLASFMRVSSFLGRLLWRARCAKSHKLQAQRAPLHAS